MNLLIMGLPGAGKGTQAAKIVEEFHVAHISTGDMFRAAMANQTEMGVLAKSYIDKGELVPDEVTNGIVKERLAQDDIKETGFLLDGYPRTIEQAHALDQTLSDLGITLEGVINIEVNPESLLERLSGRFICRTCGATYHKVFNPTKVEGTCDNCQGHDFYQREDDKSEKVAYRINLQMESIRPILDYYEERGLLHRVDGQQAIDKVYEDIRQILSSVAQ